MPDMTINIPNDLQFNFTEDIYIPPEKKESDVLSANIDTNSIGGFNGRMATGIKLGNKDVIAIHTGHNWKYIELKDYQEIKALEDRIIALEQKAKKINRFFKANRDSVAKLSTHADVTTGTSTGIRFDQSIADGWDTKPAYVGEQNFIAIMPTVFESGSSAWFSTGHQWSQDGNQRGTMTIISFGDFTFIPTGAGTNYPNGGIVTWWHSAGGGAWDGGTDPNKIRYLIISKKGAF